MGGIELEQHADGGSQPLGMWVLFFQNAKGYISGENGLSGKDIIK